MQLKSSIKYKLNNNTIDIPIIYAIIIIDAKVFLPNEKL